MRSSSASTTASVGSAGRVGAAASYGVEFSDPDWLPDVITRYQLNPPMP